MARGTNSPFVYESSSSSFQVRSYSRRLSADAVARAAEAQRSHFYWHWRDETEPADWNPRCEIVVHASRGSYLAAVGRGGETSYGSSWLDVRERKCRGRRIDLLPDAHGNLSALSHELTHVVVCDMLGGRIPPRWLDEGIALLADSQEKQRMHARDLADARSRRLTFRAVELMNLDSYPAASRVPAFYAQSASLTSFLARQGKPSLLLEFAETSVEVGCDQALREVYRIDGTAALERAWIAQSSRPQEYPAAGIPGRTLQLARAVRVRTPSGR
ncbi:MAG: hypothetical protein WD872_13520 [Pirellulaceae bacterium]